MFGSEISKAAHRALAVAADRAFGDLLDAVARCQEGGIVEGRDPRLVAAQLWTLVHGIASLAIGGELHAVGIEQDPEAMVADAVARVLG